MIDIHTTKIADELNLKNDHIRATITLLDDDATVPFIARYRKELSGGMDEVQITQVRDRIHQLRELDKRREAILKSLEERELLTDELKDRIEAAETMAELEDIYLPFKPKRRTRATIAIERGLEPLAELIFEQDDIDINTEAEKFIDSEKEINSIDDALAGARDIIAAWINEDSDARSALRKLFNQSAVVKSTVISGKETDGAKFSDYFDWEEPLAGIPSHRLLAIRRGEAEEFLRLSIAPPVENALAILEDIFIISDYEASAQVRNAMHDSYKRLLTPALETEFRAESKIQADIEAIRIFSDNLRELLMAAPLGHKDIMAIDPGFRTGCKLVCLDSQGKLEYYTAIFPHGSEKQKDDAASEVKALCGKFGVGVIAIGNGTAGRETETFIRELELPSHITIEMVNEAGASVYSASDAAREEFPNHDITVRGAVSIGRRLMDPLAELVKIDPKSIGVGQYQHDVDQSLLKQGLDDTVLSCVNAVGVDINSASKQLLTYVSGLGPQLAENIVSFRYENGPFKSRATIKKVSRLGPKAFEQAAGFLRIPDADNPLDRSAVHPESYSVVKAMAKDLGCTVGDLISDEVLRDKLSLTDYISDTTGMPTLADIMDELTKPGRDPRDDYIFFSFNESVKTMDDLEAGMSLPGIVTNVTAFGAFVDIGVHQDGLVHISEMADKFIKDPLEIVKVQQKVEVTVLNVDHDRKRIALSMRKNRI